MSRSLAVVGALALAAALAGCGKVGQLERPGPMFGHAAPPADAESPVQDPNRSIRTVDPRERPTDLTTPASEPAPATDPAESPPSRP